MAVVQIDDSMLRAIHDLVVQTRFLAYKGESSRSVARIMDKADHVINQMLRLPPDVARFDSALGDLAETHKDFKWVYNNYRERTMHSPSAGEQPK